MKAIEILRAGAPEVLQLAERPDPVSGAGEVLIRVAAAGVNRPDVLQRKGLSGAAGRVRSAGSRSQALS
jgi:NADPH2:quinone reductase